MDAQDWYESSQNWVHGDKAQRGDAPPYYQCSLGLIALDLDSRGFPLPKEPPKTFSRVYWQAFERALSETETPTKRYIVITLRERWLLDGDGHRSLTEAEILARVRRETGVSVNDADVEKAKTEIIQRMNRYAR